MSTLTKDKKSKKNKRFNAKPIASGKKAQSKSQVREFSEAILVALFFALILRTFVVQAFRIPTGSMKDTLLVGDFLLVNKFIYGARTPDSIPFTDILLPYLRLPAFKNPEPGEIVVFKFPDDPTQDYIKRCIAGPGQTIEMIDGNVFVDGKPEGKKEPLPNLGKYDPGDGAFCDYYKITRDGGQTYQIRTFKDKRFANKSFAKVYVPREGDTIELTPENVRKYQRLITKREGRTLSMSGGAVLVDGQPATEFTFSQDYYFMMGDNRDNSSDSREWGLLPRENVVGEALIIYWSWDKGPELWELHKKIRWGRLANPIR